MKRPPAYLRSIASTIPGPSFETVVQCLRCAYQWVSAYTVSPLYFRCPRCASTRGVRDDPPIYGAAPGRVH